MTTAKTDQPGRMGELVRYFLRLGLLGFGGPVALVGQMERELVARYDRRPGQREDRYGHLLGAEGEEPAAAPAAAPPADDRLERLEHEVAELRAEVAALRQELGP